MECKATWTERDLPAAPGPPYLCWRQAAPRSSAR